MLRPSQVLTLGEISKLGEIFARTLGVKPKIVHFGSHLIFYRSGLKLVLYFTLSPNGTYELEIKYFEVPANIRNQGLGFCFFKEFLNQDYIRDRFAVIRLIPLSQAARRFWEKVGFAFSTNYLYMHFLKAESEQNKKV